MKFKSLAIMLALTFLFSTTALASEATSGQPEEATAAESVPEGAADAPKAIPIEAAAETSGEEAVKPAPEAEEGAEAIITGEADEPEVNTGVKNDEVIYSVSTVYKNQNFTNTLYEVAPFDIKSENPTGTGTLPNIEVTGNTAFQDELNAIVDRFYNAAIDKALDNNIRVSFTYQAFANENYLNFGLFAKYGVGETAGEDLLTFTVAKDFCKLYELSDILGPNAYELASDFVNNTLKAEGSTFFNNGADFKGVVESTPFYFLDDETLGLAFSKDFITDSDTSIVFMLPLNELNKSIITKVETNKVNGVVSVPVRDVAEDLGYTVVWDAANQTVLLEDGDASIEIKVDVNDYAGYELEKAPEYIFSKVFVPSTFFSDILGCYVDIDNLTGNVVIDRF